MIKCSHCRKRIRENHPHVGLVIGTGKELTYHARGDCSKHVFEAVIEALGKGGVFDMRHYYVWG